jgi:Flp pilus assembly pilin Flp
MQRIRTFFARLERDQHGLTTVEYAIILCVIVAVAVGTWKSFGEIVHKSLKASSTDINTAIN